MKKTLLFLLLITAISYGQTGTYTTGKLKLNIPDRTTDTLSQVVVRDSVTKMTKVISRKDFLKGVGGGGGGGSTPTWQQVVNEGATIIKTITVTAPSVNATALGINSDNGDAIQIISNSGNAIDAESDSGNTINVESNSGNAINADSNSGDAVYAQSGSGRAIYAESNTGIGLSAYSILGLPFEVIAGVDVAGNITEFKGLNGLGESRLLASVTTDGSINGNAFIKSGGLSGEYLMADGSVSTGTGGATPPLQQVLDTGNTALGSMQVISTDGTTAVTGTSNIGYGGEFLSGNGTALYASSQFGTALELQSESGTGMIINQSINNTEDLAQFKLGNNIVAKIQTGGGIVASSFAKTNGLSTEYLMADGSVSTGSTGTGSTINTEFFDKPYFANLVTTHDKDNPNFKIDLTGNLNLTLSGTVNGDSGLVNLYFSATETALLNGTKSLTLLGTGIMIPVYFIHDTDGLKWYDGRDYSVVNSNFYTKTESDNLLNAKASSTGSELVDFKVPTIPATSNSATSKNYIDNLITGITWKNAVKVASTVNLSLSGTSNVDGVTIPTGTRILAKNQTDATQNGIYTSSSGSWTRAVDADSNEEVETSTVAVLSGTTNKNTQWTCTSLGVVIGTSTINYGQISGAGTYTNGTGIDLNANVFSINQTYSSSKENISNKQNDLSEDGTGTKYPTVDAVRILVSDNDLDANNTSSGTAPSQRVVRNLGLAKLNANGYSPNRLLITDASGNIGITSANAGSRVLITSSVGIPTASTITSTLLSNLSGSTSNIQAQLDGKINTLKGSYTTTASSSTSFTVPIGQTMVNTSYVVTPVATNTLSAVLFSVQNKTTTTFDIVIAGTPLTGTVAYDFIIRP